jgi:hypothetical protein
VVEEKERKEKVEELSDSASLVLRHPHYTEKKYNPSPTSKNTILLQLNMQNILLLHNYYRMCSN